MTVRFIQLQFTEPDTLLNAEVLSVNKTITTLSPWKFRIYRGRLEVANLQQVG